MIAFVDFNKQQLDGYTKNIIDLGDLAKKFEAFGWFVQEIDGHDVGAIQAAIDTAKENRGRPSMIVLDTIKGYGCTFAEGVELNHHMSFTKEMMDEAIEAATKRLEEAKAALAE